MNINQALRRTAVLKGEISTWSERLKNSIKWRSDEQPPVWSFAECLETLNTLSAELVDLESAITTANVTNDLTWKGYVIALSQAVRLLSKIKSQISLFNSLDVEPVATQEKVEVIQKFLGGQYVTAEKTYTLSCALSERNRAEVVSSLQKDFDELNGLVEGMNHTVTVKICSSGV